MKKLGKGEPPEIEKVRLEHELADAEALRAHERGQAKLRLEHGKRPFSSRTEGQSRPGKRGSQRGHRV